MQIEYLRRFLKVVHKLPKSEQLLLTHKIEIFKKDPQNSKLRTHALTWKMKGVYSFSLTYSKQVLFTIDNNVYTFIAIGSHDQVYRS